MAIENGVIILEGNIGAGKTTLAHKPIAPLARLTQKPSSQNIAQILQGKHILRCAFLVYTRANLRY